jgi:hypothetical protein
MHSPVALFSARRPTLALGAWGNRMTTGPRENSRSTRGSDEGAAKARLPYGPPVLTVYGSVRNLTGGTAGNGNDGNGIHSKQSDRRTKENIVRIGRHPAGFGLYLFDYKEPFKNACGRDRQFGVMADEVEKIVPEAVSIDARGYRRVNYGMLGIALP